MSFGGSSSESTPKDMTPPAYKALQQPFANLVSNLLNFQGQTPGPSSPASTSGSSQTGSSGATASTGQSRYGYNLAQPGQPGPSYNFSMGTGSMSNSYRQSPSQPTTTQNAAMQPGYVPGATYANPNDVLAGIPKYEGQTTAPITGNEQSILNQLMSASGNTNQDAHAALSNILANGGISNIPQVGTGAVTTQGITPTTISNQNVVGSNVNPNDVGVNFNATQNNPLLSSAITAAQRTTLDNLTNVLSSTLPGTFTQAGQFIQPQGTSAFNRAAALAAQSAGNTMGDIAAQLGYNAYNTNQQLNEQAAQASAANILSALQGNQQTGLTASAQNAANALTAAQRNQDTNLAAQTSNAANALQAGVTNSANQLAASGQNANNALQAQQNAAANKIAAAQAQGQLTSSEVQNLTQNLTAQALPRLIQQYGLDQGTQMFNNQVNDLLTLIQTGAGVTQPTIANQSSSNSAQIGLK